ncbi:MAG TPA: hypothetical protein VE404_04885 [Verrucomicrobiae bacterium]|nr:hypothetical protein [Verrucomicrobiae bacterium]
MERDDILDLFRVLSEGYLAGEMQPAVFARTVEGLISSNLDTVADLEDVSEQLVDYGMQGAVNPVDEADLRGVARRLIDLAAKETKGR